ncbi:MAG: DeoR/GlpR transcriptional regulator [Clostridiaceae bacterium]|nr:DeoR/GlpR transcriptional regulator [Clostridiaceae bacterium]
MKDRILRIKQHVHEQGEVKLSELEKIFPDVSAMTLRRDLKKLEDVGEVVRIKGGAKGISHLSHIKEEFYSKRIMENRAEKYLAAKKAFEYIQEDRSIYLDSGTTIMYLAQMLENQKLFITTSAPNIALECAKNSNATINLIGGTLSRENLSLSGINAVSFLDNINIDIAFLASSGFSFKNGFTAGNYEECVIKKFVVSKANKTIVVMDSTKFGKNMPFTFAHLSDIELLISDENVPKDLKRRINNDKLKLV